MRALVVDAPGSVTWQDVPEPTPGPYDALVAVEACGICSSTDRKLIDGRLSWQPKPPFILGHEAVGRVIAVGDRVRRFVVGDRVTRPVAYWPGEGPIAIGIGGFSERGIVRDHLAMADDGDPSLRDEYLPNRQVVIPQELPVAVAALGVTLAETSSVLAGLPGLRGRSVAVAGTGCVGLAFVIWAKRAGARVTVLGRRSERLDTARALGADVGIDTRAADWERQLGTVDVVIETTCDPAIANGLLGALAPGGIACAYGALPDGASYDARWSSATVTEQDAWPWVADLLVRGEIDTARLLTHEVAPAAFAGTMDAIARGDVIKAVVRIASG